MYGLFESNSNSPFFMQILSNRKWVFFKIPTSSIVGIVMRTYICHVIIQVIVTVMKKTAFVKKGIKGGKERSSLSILKKLKYFSP